jgi:uncharacterized protein YndB with AHSA1/START domain
MAEPFEVRKELELDASPDDVWEAIATGPGVDAWFMGRNEIEPREGGAVRTTLPGWSLESTVVVWDPPHRFVHRTEEGEDGRLMVFEYVVEGRERGSTVIRFVHSGFLPGDDWEDEYDALRSGDPMYLHKLGQYLKYFRGRTATPVSAWGPRVDRNRAMTVFRDALGLIGTVAEEDEVRSAPVALSTIDGVVDFVSQDTLGVRTSDGIYRFIHGLGGTVVLGHHIFSEVNQQEIERAWQSWLDRSFA